MARATSVYAEEPERSDGYLGALPLSLYCGVAQWQSEGIIILASLVRSQPPQLCSRADKKAGSDRDKDSRW